MQKLIPMLLKELAAHTTTIDEEYHLTEEEQAALAFDFRLFKRLDRKEKMKYAMEKLAKVGAGSSRVVFVVSPTTVLKIAKDQKGIAQNATERDVSSYGYSCVAQVFDYDTTDYTWIEAERATRMKTADFKATTGVPFKVLSDVLYAKHQQRYGKEVYLDPEQKKFMDSPFFSCLETILNDYDMPIGDIRRPSSWGVVNRNGAKVAVLIDYGLTGETFDKFYRK